MTPVLFALRFVALKRVGEDQGKGCLTQNGCAIIMGLASAREGAITLSEESRFSDDDDGNDKRNERAWKRLK